MLVKITLEFEFAPSNPSRFVPVELGQAHRPVAQRYPRYSLALPPPGAAIPPAEAGDLPNPAPRRDRLDAGDLSEDTEVHELRFAALGWWVNAV